VDEDRGDEAREHGAELVDPLAGAVELEPIERGGRVADDLVELAERPAVDLVERGGIDRVGVEALVVAEVAEEVAEGVADLPIGFRRLLDVARSVRATSLA
jgi:hypothetical protein